MDTIRLYYQDACARRFTARVLDCQEQKKGWAVVLDRTCFYPEGGGQPGDTGVLGDRRVLDTFERGGDLIHLTDGPLAPGSEISGEIDWDRRFDLMQQHSGEHMVSGVIHRRFGYDNVGFHMGAEVITIDFSGLLTWEDLMEVEREVCGRIWEDRPVRCWVPSPEELPDLPYRSKKALTGDVRLVEFPGADLCACCGTHVSRTGEIGLVCFSGLEKFHSGVRVEMRAGRRAMEYLSMVREQNRAVSQQLSAKVHETAKAVAAQAAELERQRQALYALESRFFAEQAEVFRGRGEIYVNLPSLSADGVRRAAIAIQETCGGRAAVFSGSDQTGYKYAVGLPGGDLRDWVKTLNAALRGRGGGKPGFVQGSVRAVWAEIEESFGN